MGCLSLLLFALIWCLWIVFNSENPHLLRPDTVLLLKKLGAALSFTQQQCQRVFLGLVPSLRRCTRTLLGAEPAAAPRVPGLWLSAAPSAATGGRHRSAPARGFAGLRLCSPRCWWPAARRLASCCRHWACSRRRAPRSHLGVWRSSTTPSHSRAAQQLLSERRPPQRAQDSTLLGGRWSSRPDHASEGARTSPAAAHQAHTRLWCQLY